MKKPGHKDSENQDHAQGVWTKFSPTGVDLCEAFCKKNFDHSDGLPWATLVFNAVTGTGKVPKVTRDGTYYPSTKGRPRLYKRYSRAIAFVPRIAPFRRNIAHIDPNERLFPSEHTSDSNRFPGTLLSAVDLVWFPEKDHASKSDYANWAGSINELAPPEFGIHQYINDVVPGYYVKSNPAS